MINKRKARLVVGNSTTIYCGSIHGFRLYEVLPDRVRGGMESIEKNLQAAGKSRAAQGDGGDINPLVSTGRVAYLANKDQRIHREADWLGQLIPSLQDLLQGSARGTLIQRLCDGYMWNVLVGLLGVQTVVIQQGVQ